MVEVGQRIAPFSLSGPDGTVRIPDADGRRTLLMFFQEAGTPTCETQVRSVAAEADLLRELDAVAVCAGTDPPERLQDWRRQVGDGVALVSDAGGRVAQQFGVFDAVSKRAQRAAFVIEGDGTVTLAIPWYNPMNGNQLASIFGALGLAER